MQVVDGENDRGKVETGDVCCEAARATQMGEEFTAWDVGQEHVDVEVVLIGCVAGG